MGSRQRSSSMNREDASGGASSPSPPSPTFSPLGPTDSSPTGGAAAPALPRASFLAAPRKQSVKLILRHHLWDWLCFCLLALLFGLLTLVDVHQTYVSANTLQNLSWPLLPNSVPSWAVPVISVCLPLVCFLVMYFITWDVCDLHASVLGLLFAMANTAVLTDAIKLAVGRPRPDFLWRCFPDGVPVFGSDGNVECNGTPSVITEGRQSFPSGHSSWCFCGLGFLSFFLMAKLHAVSSCTVDIWRLVPSLLPLVGALAVALSRVIDYWHFPSDVIAGSLLGLGIAALCYFRLYPPVMWPTCHLPRMQLPGGGVPGVISLANDVEAQVEARDLGS